MTIAPIRTDYATAFEAELNWERKRNAIERALGGEGVLPVVERVSLIDRDAFAKAVEEFYKRVFPTSPFDNLPRAS